MKQISSLLTAAVAIAVSTLAAMQPAQAQVSPATLKAISMPDKVETSIGRLEFFAGVPTDATIDKVYDTPDRMPGVPA